jgi:hypothetical protein
MRSHQPHGPVGPSSSPGVEALTESTLEAREVTLESIQRDLATVGPIPEAEVDAWLGRSAAFRRSLYDYVKS